MESGPDEAGDFIAGAIGKVLSAAAPERRAPPVMPARTRRLDIAIPVFGNAGALDRCLSSLLPTLAAGDRVWLLDDASKLEEIDRLIEAFVAAWPGAEWLRNEVNLGYTGSCNRIVAETDLDLVLLNSDTVVCAGWLEHMQACLERNPRAGIVCPVSDNATILSVLPAASRDNRVETTRAAGSASVGDVPLPTAVGFCMLIRRELLADIGGFCRYFSPGYGEENDFSMRALRAGWGILAADRACVYHASGSGSFTDERARRIKRSHQAALERIWPEYRPLVQAWWRENPLRGKTERLARGEKRGNRILHVLHRSTLVGGTEQVTRLLVESLAPATAQTLVYPGITNNAWCDLEIRRDGAFRELMLNRRWIRPSTRVSGHGADLRCLHGERALAQLIEGARPGIVHFHHMLDWDSLILPALARSMGCRVVISVHDFWFNCPQYNQIEFSTGLPCGRARAMPDARCAQCLGGHANKPIRPEKYIPARHALLRNMLKSADALIVPSRFIRRKLLEAFPGIEQERVRHVPHGVRIPGRPAGSAPGPGIVVAYLGGDLELKGASVVTEMARLLQDVPVTFRVHGRIKGFNANVLPDNVELVGFYHPDRLGEVLEGVDLVLIPSFFEESFSLVASECWAHGVPVLASSRGALPERVKPGHNGWLVKDMKPETWAGMLRSLIDSGELQACRARRAEWSVTSIEQSVQAVKDVYRELMDKPALPAAQASGKQSLQRFHEKLGSLRSGSVLTGAARESRCCLGIVRDDWAPANYRVRYPLQDLGDALDGVETSIHVVRDSGMDSRRMLTSRLPGRILAQPFLSNSGMRLMEALHREPRLRTTLVVDDLWTGVPPGNPVSRMIPDDVEERLRYLAMLSDALVFTTPALREALSFGHDNTFVIENALPEWTWESVKPRARDPEKKLRIGWAGASQHGDDLAFLADVVKATADKADWVFLGMCPQALRRHVKSVQAMVPFDKYPAALNDLGFDLAIAPLAVNDFNRCKSHLKLLEYGVLGIPAVAADLEPYQGSPALLASPDDPDDWIAKIVEMIENEEKRLSVGRQLRSWVTGNHMCRHRRSEWTNALGIWNETG